MPTLGGCGEHGAPGPSRAASRIESSHARVGVPSRLLAKVSPAKTNPIARTATKTLISSTLMLLPNPFGLFSHAP